MDWSVMIAYYHDGYGCGIEVKSMNEKNQGMHGIELRTPTLGTVVSPPAHKTRTHRCSYSTEAKADLL